LPLGSVSVATGVIEMHRLMEIHGSSFADAKPADSAIFPKSTAASPEKVDHSPDEIHEPFAGAYPAQGVQLDNLLRIHEYERQRLGQELHDSAGQLVITLQLSVAHLKRVGGDRQYDGLIEEIQDTVRLIDREIRSVAYLHYPVELGENSLSRTLELLVFGFGQRTGIRTTFKSVGDIMTVDATVSATVLRVAQEALVNVYRHSHASTVKIVLERRPDVLRLTITDDGDGFPADLISGAAGGVGLQGMRHRVKTAGGRFGIKNHKRGAQVWAKVPV
jgi:signal transduction histidine kinase